MEVFRTLVPIPQSEKKISYSSKLMLLGSCFSEYIGQKLVDAKFTLDNNPFGIVYNPLSIKHQLENLIKHKEYTAEDLFLNEGTWRCFDHHSKFSDPNKDESLQKINARIHASHQFLKSANILFLTFGTSYVYFLKTTRQIVSNCHKIPAREFIRERIAVQDIVKEFSFIVKELKQFNPNIHIAFTVSPVRHWKDGPHGNQISKAILLLAIDEICSSFQESTSYFPSYEIVMDELRDYRFFEEDMLHPNKIAVNYIWNRLKECYMESSTIAVMKEVEQVVQAASHKPFNPKEEAFLQFARKNLERIQSLKKQYQVDLILEESYFKSFLA